MSKTEDIKQVTTKNPKRVEASKKSYEKRMLKMKKDILENAGITDSTNDTNGIKGLTTNATNDTKDLSSNDSNTVKSNNDVYFYGVGGLSILAIGILVYYKFNPQKKSVEVNTKVETPKPVYRRML